MAKRQIRVIWRIYHVAFRSNTDGGVLLVFSDGEAEARRLAERELRRLLGRKAQPVVEAITEHSIHGK
ncbi:MAG: hypothetical protein U0521_28585 [Anaerolineae bacterium]